MKNKGFTLIELLAVIVILAIIALIATPIVLNIIGRARKGAAKTSAMSYIKAVETYAMTTELDSKMTKIEAGPNSVTTLNELVELKGTKPTSGTVTIDNNYKVTSATLVINGYTITYDGKDYTIEGGSGSNEPSTPVITGPTKVAASATDTHKGIVYLDPTDLNKECNATNSVSTTGTKTGCMKWYIYNDSGDNYKMILDHNAIARVKWYSSNSNVAYASSEAKAAMDATLTNWKVTPDFITTSEINAITGKTGFDSSNSNLWYSLNTKTQTQGTFDANTRSKYDWLYNNTYKCKSDSTDYGCTVEDNSQYAAYNSDDTDYTYGYWTQDTVGTPGTGNIVWVITRNSLLGHYGAKESYCGIRPVIEIPKTQVN